MPQAEIVKNCNRAGALAEAFCLETFGIVEDDRYEIKASSTKNSRVIVRAVQLAASGRKHYVVVQYNRKRRRLTRGPRKGARVFDETIPVSFQREVEVYTIRGFDLFRAIVRERLPLRMTKVENDAEWAFYWYVPIKDLPTDVLVASDRYVLHGNPLDPPPFIEELDRKDEVPF